jgi:3-oxoacyl-[acyl-carrier protein] reductase
MEALSNKPLKERAAVVTGASRGIGKAIALELGKRGANVIINYVSSDKAAKDVVEKINSLGSKALAVKADVSDYNQASDLINKTVEEFGKIDILVNNAGITRDTLIMMMSEEDWDDVQRINLKGTFNCSKPAIKHMMRKRYGRIINITSVAGQMGNVGQTNYSASKAGQIGFTKALAREIAPRNITVNAVAAGYVETDIWDGVPEDVREGIMGLIPMKRKGEPEEIAYAVAFLASDEAGYITGQCIGIDGGMAMA